MIGEMLRSTVGWPVREIILEEKIMEPEDLSRILDPVSMTEPGIKRV